MRAHHLPPATRPRAFASVLALGLVLAVLLSGCGGGKAEKKEKKAEARPSSAASASSGGEPAPDPGYGVPRVGECHRMTARQSVASVATSRAVACRKSHTSVVAHVGYLPRPVTPATPVAKRRALGKRLCEPAYRRVAGGTLADRATSLLTWTLFTPGQAELERGARWVRCDVVARSGNTLVPLPPGNPMLAKGVPESLRICQTATGSDISCALPHAFRVQAVYRAVGSAYPDVAAYTVTARARCQQLTGSPGGFWQPPSRPGWRAGDRFIRCLTPQTLPQP
jgi:Septum formation